MIKSNLLWNRYTEAKTKLHLTRKVILHQAKKEINPKELRQL